MAGKNKRLQRAIDECRQVLVKYDTGGVIILHRPQYGTEPGQVWGDVEYLLHIDPTYSCAFIQNGNQLRVRLKTAEVGPQRAAQLAGATANMFTMLAQATGEQSLNLYRMLDLVNEKWNTEDLGGDYKGDTRRRVFRKKAEAFLRDHAPDDLTPGAAATELAHIILELTNDLRSE